MNLRTLQMWPRLRPSSSPLSPALTGLCDPRICSQANFVRVSDSLSSSRSRSCTLRRAVYAHRVLAIPATFWNCRETRDSTKWASWASSCCTRSRSSSPRTWGGQARSRAGEWGGGRQGERSYHQQPARLRSGSGSFRTWGGLNYSQSSSPGNCRASLLIKTLRGFWSLAFTPHFSLSKVQGTNLPPSGKSLEVPPPEDESSTFLTRLRPQLRHAWKVRSVPLPPPPAPLGLHPSGPLWAAWPCLCASCQGAPLWLKCLASLSH